MEGVIPEGEMAPPKTPSPPQTSYQQPSYPHFLKKIEGVIPGLGGWVCREFLTFNAYWLNSSYQIWVWYIFVFQKFLKRTFKTGFWVQNHLLKLYSSAKNTRRLLCSQKVFWEVFVLKLSVIQWKLFYI